MRRIMNPIGGGRPHNEAVLLFDGDDEDLQHDRHATTVTMCDPSMEFPSPSKHLVCLPFISPPFQPPLYLQRYMLVDAVLKHYRVQSLLDVGCNDGALLRYVTTATVGRQQSLRLAVGVDGCPTTLQHAASLCQQTLWGNVSLRHAPCRLVLVQADLAGPRRRPSNHHHHGTSSSSEGTGLLQATSGQRADRSCAVIAAVDDDREQHEADSAGGQWNWLTADEEEEADETNDFSSSSPPPPPTLELLAAIEVIEHIPKADLARFTERLFGHWPVQCDASYVLLTTPRYEAEDDEESEEEDGDIASCFPPLPPRPSSWMVGNPNGDETSTDYESATMATQHSRRMMNRTETLLATTTTAKRSRSPSSSFAAAAAEFFSDTPTTTHQAPCHALNPRDTATTTTTSSSSRRQRRQRRLRHSDHKFEWTASEFRRYCEGVVHCYRDVWAPDVQYLYCGKGFSQGALFYRRRRDPHHHHHHHDEEEEFITTLPQQRQRIMADYLRENVFCGDLSDASVNCLTGSSVGAAPSVVLDLLIPGEDLWSRLRRMAWAEVQLLRQSYHHHEGSHYNHHQEDSSCGEDGHHHRSTARNFHGGHDRIEQPPSTIITTASSSVPLPLEEGAPAPSSSSSSLWWYLSLQSLGESLIIRQYIQSLTWHLVLSELRSLARTTTTTASSPSSTSCAPNWQVLVRRLALELLEWLPRMMMMNFMISPKEGDTIQTGSVVEGDSRGDEEEKTKGKERCTTNSAPLNGTQEREHQWAIVERVCGDDVHFLNEAVLYHHRCGPRRPNHYEKRAEEGTALQSCRLCGNENHPHDDIRSSPRRSTESIAAAASSPSGSSSSSTCTELDDIVSVLCPLLVLIAVLGYDDDVMEEEEEEEEKKRCSSTASPLLPLPTRHHDRGGGGGGGAVSIPKRAPSREGGEGGGGPNEAPEGKPEERRAVVQYAVSSITEIIAQLKTSPAPTTTTRTTDRISNSIGANVWLFATAAPWEFKEEEDETEWDE